MGLFDWLKKGVNKRKTTQSVTTIPSTSVPPVRSVDFGTSEQERIGGVNVVGGQVGGELTITKTSSSGGGGGGGGTTDTYSVSVPTTQQTTPSYIQKTNIDAGSVGLLKPAAPQSTKGTAINYGPAPQERVISVYPYLTRTDPTISGYSRSGKPIYDAGKVVEVNPYAYGPPKPATQEQITQFETYEKSQGHTLTPKVDYSPEDYYGVGRSVPYNPPATIRGFAYDIGGGVAYGLKKAGINLSPSAFATTKRVAGEVALFSAFAPAFKTTSQYQIDQATFTEVKFRGVKQSYKGNNRVETAVQYNVYKGGKFLGKGVAKGQSVFKQVGENTGFITKAGGSSFSRGANIPTGEIIKFSNKFTAAEVGISRSLTPRLTEQASVGILKSGAGRYAFASKSLGLRVGNKLTFVRGATLTSDFERVISTGIIKSLRPQSSFFTYSILPSNRVGSVPLNAFDIQRAAGQTAVQSSVFGAMATQSTQSIVRASVSPIIKTTMSSTFLPVITAFRTTTRQTITTSPNLINRTNLRETTQQITIVRNFQDQGVRQKPFFSPSVAGAGRTSPVVKPVLFSGIAQEQPQRQRYRLITPQVTRGGQSGLFVFRPPRTTTPPFIFGLKLGLETGGSFRILRGARTGRGYTPSFSALVFNIRGAYRPIRTLKISGLDLRPIKRRFKFPTGLSI